MPVFRIARSALLATALLLLASSRSFAVDWYVDNLLGSDANTGLSQQIVDDQTGPVKTIRRALRRIKPGDTVHLVNHGTPYYESLEIVGPRFIGTGIGLFTLEGHGAIVSGAKPVPFDAWRRLGNGLWKFTPFRKAYYQLILDEKPLPEVVNPAISKNMPEIPAGHWCAWRGSIYYRQNPEPRQTPNDLPLWFAGEEVGVTLYEVDGVVIRDLTFRHFRLDGVNAHDRARNVILENVKLQENGRSGIAVGGTSLVGLKDSQVVGNRVTQALVTERAQLELMATELGDGPGTPFQIRGGHLLIDGVDAAAK